MRRPLFVIMFALSALVAMAQASGTDGAVVGSWQGKLQLGQMSLTIVVHIQQEDNQLKCTLDSPDQGAKGIPGNIDFLSDDSLAISVKSIGASYKARIEGDRLVGTFSQNFARIPLTLIKGEVEKPKRPQLPSQPLPYATEEVSFRNDADHATLAATLTYPQGFESMRKGRVPVVVMVTGSGQENRDEEVFEHKPFLVIADYLARHGIASLRYDDRGFGASVGGDRIGSQITTLDNKRDAEAAIRFLRSQRKFGKIGVIGHSEGANVAFMLAADGLADFIVSMAGVGVRADSALTAQTNRILQLQGQPLRLTVAQYRANALATHNPWIEWFINYDPTPHIAAVKCPVLALNGDKDCQVVSDLNLSGIRTALPKNKKSVVKEYPSLNHLFQHCQTGSVNEYRSIVETVSPEVLHDIVEWINRYFAKK